MDDYDYRSQYYAVSDSHSFCSEYYSWDTQSPRMLVPVGLALIGSRRMLTFLIFPTIEPGLSLQGIRYEVSKKGIAAARKYVFRGIRGEADIMTSVVSISEGRRTQVRDILLSMLHDASLDADIQTVAMVLLCVIGEKRDEELLDFMDRTRASVPNACLILEYLAVKTLLESRWWFAQDYLLKLLWILDTEAMPEVELFAHIALVQCYSELNEPELERTSLDEAILLEGRMEKVPEAWKSVLITAKLLSSIK